MQRCAYPIRPVDDDLLGDFLAYLTDHASDNGSGDTPLFMPSSRSSPWTPSEEKTALFRSGLRAPVGQASWLRAWTAHDPTGLIAGHVDLRAPPLPSSSHRAVLGLGVHRDHRRRGLGELLLDHVLRWAHDTTTLEWIDLRVLGSNLPARKLYLKLGFLELASIPDMFRIDGESVADIAMTKHLRA